jgi:chromosome segregation ATPase
LQALEAGEAAGAALQREADARLKAMEDLTAFLAERDQAIGALRAESGERLQALQATEAERSAVQREADIRLKAMEDLTVFLAERDRAISALRAESAERLYALETNEAERSAVQREADARLKAMEDLTAFLAERDKVIGAVRANQSELNARVTELLFENQTIQQRLIDFERENLYNSVVRQTKRYFHRRVPDSPKR